MAEQQYSSVSDFLRDDGATTQTQGTTRTDPNATVPSGGAVGGHQSPGSGGSVVPDNTETVSQAYLAALAAMGKNTSGDTSPYVIMSPGAGTASGGLSVVTLLIVAALAAGAWWFYKHRQGV